MNHPEDNRHDTDDTVFDPISLLDHEKTKKLLFREEPKIARLSQQNVRMIDTTAVLFLKDLVSITSSRTTEQSDCITLRDLRSAISSNESLHFLKTSVDCLKESNRMETPYLPTKKAKRHSLIEPNNKKIKKVKSVLGNHRNDEETVGFAIAVSEHKNASTVNPTLEIVPDDDDYD
ncbi:unnamed protein product [Cylindrotheca closterium]|uniref:Uncharacterized protein n=1 Tax=Cylindrotheca closterium TaxID=2856 RepID=A0AAD2CE75_9STRA|nr:unnamed protein product [Cylindrotheca closterium]